MLKKIIFLLVLCISAGIVFAADAPTSDNFALNLELVNGTTDTVVVVGSWDIAAFTPNIIQGYTFGICNDPAKASIGDCSGARLTSQADVCGGVACANISCTADVTSEKVFGFNTVNIYDDGLINAVIFDMFQTWGLESKTRFEMLQIKYSGLQGQSTVSVCDTLGDPAVETIFVWKGASLSPAVKGEVVIGEGGGPTCPEYALKLSTKTEDSVEKVVVSLDTAGPADDATKSVSGFSFGVAHDSADVNVKDVAVGADVLAANGGNAPDFWGVTKIAGQGVTVGCVIALSPDGADWHTIPQCKKDQEIAVISYVQTVAEGNQVDIQASLTGDLGTPKVDIEVVNQEGGIADATLGAAVPVAVTEFAGGAISFIRGDVNQDGRISVADGISIAKYLYNMGSMVDLIKACEDSADANDDGALDNSDPIYLLSYLFIGGDPIPAPLTQCGVDSTDDNLSCDSFTCP